MEHPKRLFNVKALFCDVLNTLEGVDDGTVDIASGTLKAKLHSVAIGYLTYELKRSVAAESGVVKEHMRNIELKNFDYLPQ